MPASIVSDRGSNWDSKFWRAFCEFAGTQQRLSTAYHPQTDGASERLNQEIQAYLRAYVAYSQRDWDSCLPAAMLALNNRKSASTGVSPFFLEHGYHVSPLKVAEATGKEDPRVIDARKLLRRLEDTIDFVHATAAAAQQRSEDATNKKRA